MNRAIALLLFPLACASHQTLSERVLNAALSGRVLDEQGAPVDSAEVVATAPDGQRFVTATESDGRFAFFKLAPGDYNLLTQKEGYDPASSGNRVVRDGVDRAVVLSLRKHRDQQMTPPSFIFGPTPEYTDEAYRHRAQGTVAAKCMISVEGKVTQCRILRSVEYMDAAVVKALEARRYKAALIDGKPVEVTYTFKINLYLP